MRNWNKGQKAKSDESDYVAFALIGFRISSFRVSPFQR